MFVINKPLEEITESDRFYTRSTNGRYRLDIQELRSAFVLSENVGEKIKQFRQNRISDIYANNLPIPFHDSPKIALHMIPMGAFNPRHNYDMPNIRDYIEEIKKEHFLSAYEIFNHLKYVEEFLEFGCLFLLCFDKPLLYL